MYKSPIETIIGEMKMQQNGEICRVVQEVGINVDKDELIKALQYDREQYGKGYSDGYKDAIKEFAESLKRKSELVAPSVWAIPYRAVAVADIDKLLERMGCNDG